MRLAVGDVTAAEDHGVVEHVAGALRDVLERGEEIGEAGHDENARCVHERLVSPSSWVRSWSPPVCIACQ